MAIDDVPISPMQLARKLKIRPQQIYGLIRQGRVKDIGSGGKKLVNPIEVIEALGNPQKRGRPSTDQVLEDFKISTGEILSWVVEVHKQVAVVEKEGETNVTLRGMLENADKKRHEVYMKKTSLAQHIKDGTITSTDAWSILEAVVLSWRLNGREQLANTLQEFIDANKQESTNPQA